MTKFYVSISTNHSLNESVNGFDAVDRDYTHLRHFLACNPINGIVDGRKLSDRTFDPMRQTMTFSFTKRDVYRRFVAYLDGTSFEVVSKGRCKCGSGNKTCNACKKATVPRENQFFQVIPGEKLKENYSWAVENLSEDHFQVESLTPEEVAELKELGSFVTLAERLGIIPIGFYPSYVRDIDLRGMTIWCVFQNEADKEKFWDALHHDETRDD